MQAQVEEADAGPEFDMNLLPAEWRNPCHEELAALAVAEIASYIETESSSDSVISVSPASPAADGASWWGPCPLLSVGALPPCHLQIPVCSVIP